MTLRGVIRGRWPPASWTTSVRRRRLAFVAAMAPGVFIVALSVAVWRDLAVLAAGILWCGTAVLLRWLWEPRCLERKEHAWPSRQSSGDHS